MKDLKITEVQVDCRELSQEQIDKMFSIAEKYGYTRDGSCNIIAEDLYYLSVCRKKFGIYIYDDHCQIITYDQFINLFDKPKNNLKKRLKKLEDRITLLEQKLSEKELEINIEQGMQFYNHINNAYYDIIDVEDGFVRVKRQKRDGINKYHLIDVVKLVNSGLLELKDTFIDKKEIEPKDGDICKFWDNEESNYKIGRYLKRSELVSAKSLGQHINTLEFISYKNAKVISLDEAIKLFKKQLLNEN